ncbi:hypothetical protein ACLB2K_074384 [Fragaria x ananassa]
MLALCQKSRSDIALHVFQEMDYQGCNPDRESYRILMRGLCEDRRLNEATHLLYSMFWRISQKGCAVDIVIYRTLLDALCNNGKVEEAVEMLGKILRKGLKAPKKFHLKLDLSRYNYGEDTEGIKRLINEALDRGFRPTSIVYGAKAAALCRERKVVEAVEMIEKEMVWANCVPTVKVFSIVVKGLCHEKQSVLAFEFLKKMEKQVGCVADKETYGVSVDGLCCESRFLEASRVLQEMLIRSRLPCAETYSKVIRGGNTMLLCGWRR